MTPECDWRAYRPSEADIYANMNTDNRLVSASLDGKHRHRIGAAVKFLPLVASCFAFVSYRLDRPSPP
jgi:hypothetical protein